MALSVREFDPDIKLGLTVGFLGAFTTFSALCRETVDLLGRGDYFFALAYMILSVVLGLLGAYAGISLIRGMFKETLLQRKERPESDENQTT
ncbi:putative fluoride ion transporter CrcB [bioreactor metagenome]|uniref:Putative fluoride ion transporter CrcB n=1 Tax=bioreactor metagenome TaxID=1076179 RepID=A0A645GU38_9ZZZZ